MSTTPTKRHALGMPAGSVRALLGLAVLGVLWVLALRFRGDRLPLVFVYLQFLMILILTHYFAAHGKTLGRSVSEKSALGLPSGSVRLLLVGGYVGLAYFLWNSDSAFEMPASGPVFLLIALLMSGFFVGYLITKMVSGASGGELPYWFQDFQAWTALLAVTALVVLVLIHTVINPGLIEKIPADTIEAILAALVGFYFGARS